MPDKWGGIPSSTGVDQTLPFSQSLLEVGVGIYLIKFGFFLQHARQTGLVPTGVDCQSKSCSFIAGAWSKKKS